MQFEEQRTFAFRSWYLQIEAFKNEVKLRQKIVFFSISQWLIGEGVFRRWSCLVTTTSLRIELLWNTTFKGSEYDVTILHYLQHATGFENSQQLTDTT